MIRLIYQLFSHHLSLSLRNIINRRNTTSLQLLFIFFSLDNFFEKSQQDFQLRLFCLFWHMHKAKQHRSKIQINLLYHSVLTSLHLTLIVHCKRAALTEVTKYNKVMCTSTSNSMSKMIVTTVIYLHSETVGSRQKMHRFSGMSQLCMQQQQVGGEAEKYSATLPF